MKRRTLLLLTLLLLALAGVALYRMWPRYPGERFSFKQIFQEPDPFDEPYESDPELVREFAARKIEFPFKSNDRVAWIGSSSTRIGQWCAGMEFLLRSRHPELKLSFSKHSTGGGTFETGVERMPEWLENAKPSLVFLNYGANDASSGQKNLDDFHEALRACVVLAEQAGARALLMTPQSGDTRATGPRAFFRRRRYADDMLAFCKANGWTIVDIHHPLEELQVRAENEDSVFTLNTDGIHLTDSAYAAWAFFLYDRLNPPDVESALELNARNGTIISARNCGARVVSTGDALEFERRDDVLPILPPEPLPASDAGRKDTAGGGAGKHDRRLPPRRWVPLEARSKYLLKIAGLFAGHYALECNGQPAGSASAEEFAAGVNLNTLLLDATLDAPWKNLAEQLWSGSGVGELSGRTLVFRLKKQ